ncbi:hypothetical protein KI387_001380, partial [Taxus chinensis]
SGTVGTKVRGGRGSAGLAQVSPFRVVQRICPRQSGTVGTKYAEDANRPVRPKQRTFVWDIRAKSTRGTRKAERAESEWNLATCLRRKEEQGSPNRAVRRNLSQTVWDIRAK